MNDLFYGRYFVKETKAPEGFVLDTGVYEVMIDTNGKTYEVENKAGVGFINDAMRGNLKIVKTSSDGKVKGFAFRITGANGYDIILETNDKGEIFIDGLRIGDYTISEVSNSASSMYVMVGDYTVLCAVNIGSREIILAENEQSANGERFLCCYGERNDIFEKFSECAVGDDYIDAALFFAERIKKDAEQFRAEVEKLDIPVTVITQVDCIPDHYKNDINGKIIAINPAVLKPEYQRADRQLYLVTGGFGASANARGSAVFCRNLYDGKDTAPTVRGASTPTRSSRKP